MTEKEFVKKWISEIEELLKKFPDNFINSFVCDKMVLPGKSLVPGSELFGTYEILDIEGNLQIQVPNYTKLKYILYSNRFKPIEILIPRDEEEIKKAVKEYENHLDSFLLSIEKEYKSLFHGSSKFKEVSNMIFSTLNILRY